MKLDTRLKAIVIFGEMVKILDDFGETYRSDEYKKNIKLLRMNKVIRSPGFKKKFKIIENMKTQDFNKYPDLAKLMKMKNLIGVPGFGPKAIQDYMNKDNYNLTKVQKVGLKYHKKILRNIDRHDIEEISNKIKTTLERRNLISWFTIAGSFRRGKEIGIGDIDILVTPSTPIDKVISTIKKHLSIYHDTFVEGGSKFSFLVKHNKKLGKKILNYTKDLIQVDIRFIKNPSSKPFMLLYFTGNKNFNLMVRSKAKKSGYKLNEYGLFDRKTNTPISKDLSSESKILKFIGIKEKFNDPSMREI